ncbi:MAG: hypothetical protein MUO57_14075, partial [Anaerolineales bacterium]|nr:hypothetical protein [Anaerolineales bacterium]
FASPPGVGESSPMVNVIWGLANLILGFIMVFGVGKFETILSLDMLIMMAGFCVMSLVLAWHFGRVRNPVDSSSD